MFVWGGLKSISEEEFQGRELYKLKPGDILFNNTNSKELVGKTCLITQEIRGGFSNHITRIRVKKNTCDPKYLAMSLHHAWRQGKFLSRANKSLSNNLRQNLIIWLCFFPKYGHSMGGV